MPSGTFRGVRRVIIVGGSFGRSGRAEVDDDGRLVLRGDVQAAYPMRRVTWIEASRKEPGVVGCLGYAVGIPAVAVLGFLVFGVLGTLAGFGAAVIGVYISARERSVRLAFDDGRRVDLVCTPKDARRLDALWRAGR
ncbi:MAG: hypothetical protein R3298_11830 [Gammaproteobacteria bacterium]|nr:hypothetical protein [Gammaproteobacteria bacterium]